MADRDAATGKFVPGNRAAVGNRGGRPPRATEERLLQELADAITTNGTLKACLDKVKEKFKAGDLDYIKFVFGYLVGMPVQRSSVSLSGRDALEDWMNDLRQVDHEPSNGVAEPGAEATHVG